MGFFGKLFEKKECAICGGEIGLLGNRKLEDGNMCRHCAARLSPWFSDRRNSTIAEIEEQLAYREENQRALESFRPVYEIGYYYKLFADEVNGVPQRFLVTGGDYRDENSDLIPFADVVSCQTDISESRRELKYSNDKNEMVSYSPPRYEYSYDFYVDMYISNNPYFDRIHFKLNSGSVDIIHDGFGGPGRHGGPGRPGGPGGFGREGAPDGPGGLGRAGAPGGRGRAGGPDGPGILGLAGMLLGGMTYDPANHPEYRRYQQMCDKIEALVEAGRRGAAIAQQAEEQAPVEEAPRAKFCPNCGEPVSGGRFCANCGNKL